MIPYPYQLKKSLLEYLSLQVRDFLQVVLLKMEIEDIESTLDALRKLYGLLGTDGDSSPDFTSKALDDKSRLLLKRLLDMAAKNVLKARPEMVAGQVASSYTQCSTEPLQLSDGRKQLSPALLNQSEIPSVIQYSENDLENFHQKYTKTASEETPPILHIPGVAASPFRSINKCCSICNRRISKQSSLHQFNNQINIFSELSRSLEKENQKGLHGLDQAATRSSTFSLNRPETSAMKSTEESKVIDSLSEEASDIIKIIDLCIRNLKIGSQSLGLYTSTSDPVDGIPQNEFPDKISDFVPQVELGSPVVETKSPEATTTELGQVVYSDADCGDSLHQRVNEQHRDSSPQCQMPSKTMSQEMEMKLLKPKYIQSLKILPPKNSMMSTGSHIPVLGEDPLHGDKEMNQRVDRVFGQNVNSIVAKIESLYQASQNDVMPSETYFNCLSPSSYMTERDPALDRAMQNDLMPREMYNFKYLSPNQYINAERVPGLVTWFVNQIKKENLQGKQSIIDDIIKRQGAYQPSGLQRVPCDYLLSDKNIQTCDTRCKMNETSRAQGKRNLSSQVFEGHTELHNWTPRCAGNSKWMDGEQVGNPKKKYGINPPRKISDQKHEYDDYSLDSGSSNWRSQQVSTSNSESEEYAPGWGQRRKYGIPSASSESGVYSLRRRHQQHHTDRSSKSGVYSLPHRCRWHHMDASSSLDEYSLTSSDRNDGDHELTSFSSNESTRSVEYSLPSNSTTDPVSSIGDSGRKRSLHGPPPFQHHKQPRHFHMDLTSETTGSNRFLKQTKDINSKKDVGTWKKLKDKLSIIFHHHHHHYHHHHHRHDPDYDSRDASNHESRISRGKYLSRRREQTPLPVRLDAYGEQAAEKLGKPLINAVHHKNKHHHFNGLLRGLFRHIRHSKKSKISAKNIKLLGKGQHEGEKARRKQHWWHLLQRQRKLKNLGLGYNEKSKKRFSKIK